MSFSILHNFFSNFAEALVQYLKYVNKLKFKSKPDYQYCRNLFKRAVRDAGYTFNGDLSLNVQWLQVPRKVSIRIMTLSLFCLIKSVFTYPYFTFSALQMY